MHSCQGLDVILLAYVVSNVETLSEVEKYNETVLREIIPDCPRVLVRMLLVF